MSCHLGAQRTRQQALSCARQRLVTDFMMVMPVPISDLSKPRIYGSTTTNNMGPGEGTYVRSNCHLLSCKTDYSLTGFCHKTVSQRSLHANFFNLHFFAPKEEVYPHCEAFLEIMRLQIDGVSHVWFVVTTTPVVLLSAPKNVNSKKSKGDKAGHCIWPLAILKTLGILR